MSLSDIPYIRWAKLHGGEGEIALTMSAVPPVDWEDIGLDPRDIALHEFSAYGDPDLRAGVAGEWGWGPERVMLAAGASHSHFCVAASILEPGDRVLHEVPGYLPLLDSLSLLRIEPVPFERRLEEGYRLDLDALRTAVERTRPRVVLLTDLHNPSGVALTETERRGIAELVDSTGVVAIVDEMYRPFRDPDPGPIAGLHERCVTIGGLNKVHGLSQIRIGWAIASPERVARAQRVLDATTLHNSCLTDQVGRAAWPHRERLVARARRFSAEGWAVTERWLADTGLEHARPDGGLTCFPRIPADRFPDGDAFREAALARGVNVTPGRFFGAPAHVRIGFGLEPPRLARALEILAPLLADGARA